MPDNQTTATCETHGHLWGALGRCVMCGLKRAVTDQEKLTIAYRDQRDLTIGALARANGKIDRLRSLIREVIAAKRMSHEWVERAEDELDE